MLNKYLLVAMIVIGFGLGIGFQQTRISNLKAEHAEYRQEMAEKTVAAQDALLTYTAAVQNQLTFHRNKYNDTIQHIQTNYTNAESARLALLKRLRNITNHTPTKVQQAPEDGKRGESEYDYSALDMYFRLLDRHSAELQSVGDYADKLKAVGLMCEATADAWSEQSPLPAQ